MIKPLILSATQMSKRHLLKSTTFFSTLEHAEVPDTAINLSAWLIEQLREEWESVCKAAEQHLNDRVSAVSDIKT
jgi:hypothetical protein